MFFKESYRVLINGGVLRLSFPELSFHINKYIKQLEWDTANPTETYGDKINDMFYSYEHKYHYDCETLKREIERVGFKKIVELKWGKSKIKELNGVERNYRFKMPCFEIYK